MSNERLHFLLIGQFAAKRPDVKDRLTAKPAKIGIAKPGEINTAADRSYSKRGFKW